MPKVRISTDGYFMGTFYKKGSELMLNEKQAKYGLLSGQLEPLDPPVQRKIRREDEGVETTVPPQPAAFNLPRQPSRVKRDEQGEYSTGRSVGGQVGDRVKR